jgi:Ca2+-binding EF-hand superfamily protein
VASSPESLPAKLREEARAMFLQTKSSQLLHNEELQELWVLLEKSVPQASEPGEPQTMDYSDFKRIGALLGNSKAKRYVTPVMFAKLLDGNRKGRVSILNFFNYVMRKVWLQQTKIALSLYDATGNGYLRESDLENYILELIPTLSQLDSLEKAFHPFYVCIAVRKFFFFLDPYRYGKIKILDILDSGFLDDVLELRDEDLSKVREEANWFSAYNALRLYGQYIGLDEDHNGMLSKKELEKFGNSSLTSVFIDRIFDECITYEGEIDFKTYVDLVLAIEYKKEPQALYYFFRLLDLEGKGFLDTFVLNYFFKALQKRMKDQGQEALEFTDVCSEIFDMVKPVASYRITFADLVNSGQGETVVNILTDFSGFWAYENRDLSVIDLQEEAEV